MENNHHEEMELLESQEQQAPKKKRIMNHSTVVKRLEELELVGVLDIAKLLNWSAPKVTTYAARGKLPDPVGKISGRPVWYKQEIIQTAMEQKPEPWKIYEDNQDWEDPYKKEETKKKESATA